MSSEKAGRDINPVLWGSALWNSYHTIQFAYPEVATQQDKEKYKQYLKAFENFIPCKSCASSYADIVRSNPPTDEVLSSRKNLTTWGWNIHNIINKKLGKTTQYSYEDLCQKYDSEEAKCMTECQGNPTKYTKDYRSRTRHALVNYAKSIGAVGCDEILKRFDNGQIKQTYINLMQYHVRRTGKGGVGKNGLPTSHELLLLLLSKSTMERDDVFWTVSKMLSHNHTQSTK